MLRKNRLFTPGPTPLLPAAQFAMAGLHSASPDCGLSRTLHARSRGHERIYWNEKRRAGPGVFGHRRQWEASVSNLTSPGDKVLVLTAGKFGERWQALAKAFGCQVETLSKPYGQTFSLDEIQSKLTPDVKCVYVQATESSTGARHDIQVIAKLAHAMDDTLLVVDAITGLGTTHFDVDGWGVDIIIGGSQKAS